MTLFAQQLIRLEGNDFWRTVDDLVVIATSNPLYVLGGLVVAVFAGRMIFANRAM